MTTHFAALIVVLFLAATACASEQQKPLVQSPEPPLAPGPVPPPIVQNPQTGFVPYHLIPVAPPRRPILDAIDRVRCIAQRRPRLLPR